MAAPEAGPALLRAVPERGVLLDALALSPGQAPFTPAEVRAALSARFLEPATPALPPAHFARTPDLAAPLAPAPLPARTALRFVRAGLRGDIVGAQEVRVRRAAATRRGREFVRGRVGSSMFAPGGLDEVLKGDGAGDDDAEEEEERGECSGPAAVWHAPGSGAVPAAWSLRWRFADAVPSSGLRICASGLSRGFRSRAQREAESSEAALELDDDDEVPELDCAYHSLRAAREAAHTSTVTPDAHLKILSREVKPRAPFYRAAVQPSVRCRSMRALLTC
jgi:hypothetical protein